MSIPRPCEGAPTTVPIVRKNNGRAARMALWLGFEAADRYVRFKSARKALCTTSEISNGPAASAPTERMRTT